MGLFVPKPAVFLDRDGVICTEKGYVVLADELEIFPYSKRCVADLHDLGYLVIVVTNQSGVARGYLSEKELLNMNEILCDKTGVDAVYYCPYYAGGKIEKYSIESDLRKPGIGMIKQACKDFRIDLKQSIMVGDRASDILTGQNAGLITILLESGYGTKRLESNVTPDYIFNDLLDVVDYCRKERKRL